MLLKQGVIRLLPAHESSLLHRRTPSQRRTANSVSGIGVVYGIVVVVVVS